METEQKASVKALVEEAWSAIESGEIHRLADVMSPDIDLQTATGRGTGIEYAQRVFGRHVEAYPDITHQVLGCVESADQRSVALEIAFTATHRGELRTPLGVIEPTGRLLTWHSSDHVSTEDGRIVRWRAYFDRLELLEQLGRMDLLAGGR